MGWSKLAASDLTGSHCLTQGVWKEMVLRMTCGGHFVEAQGSVVAQAWDEKKGTRLLDLMTQDIQEIAHMQGSKLAASDLTGSHCLTQGVWREMVMRMTCGGHHVEAQGSVVAQAWDEKKGIRLLDLMTQGIQEIAHMKGSKLAASDLTGSHCLTQGLWREMVLRMACGGHHMEGKGSMVAQA